MVIVDEADGNVNCRRWTYIIFLLLSFHIQTRLGILLKHFPALWKLEAKPAILKLVSRRHWMLGGFLQMPLPWNGVRRSEKLCI